MKIIFFRHHITVVENTFFVPMHACYNAFALLFYFRSIALYLNIYILNNNKSSSRNPKPHIYACISSGCRFRDNVRAARFHPQLKSTQA